MKRYIHLILAILMVPAVAGARSVESTAGRLDLGDMTDSELRVTGSVDASDLFNIADNMPSLKVLDLSGCVIEAYNGKPVKGSGSYAAASIPAACFAGTGIESVILPSSATIAIGDGAFAASKIKSLTVSVPASIGDGAFAACADLAAVTITGSCDVRAYAFRYCAALTNARLTGVTSLGDKAFAGCQRLADVSFGAGLTRIGASAFENCDLAAADLTATKVTAIGAWAFAGNTSLASASLPATVASLGKGVFADCPSLAAFTMPQACSELPDYALKDAGVTKIALSQTASIGAYSLKGASGIEELALPSSLAAIGDNAMEGATGLKVIDASALTEVPGLGDDVWRGVDQAAVALIVKETKTDDFRNTPQWQDFRIIDMPTSLVGSTPASGRVDGAIVDGTLHLKSVNSDMTGVEVYDIAGATVASSAPGGDVCAISLEGYSGRVYIVRVTLADKSVTTLKLAR